MEGAPTFVQKRKLRSKQQNGSAPKFKWENPIKRL